jgi:uncharacterized protein (DUF58 family)
MARQLVRGAVPRFEDVATSRGLLIKERQESIFSDAWIPVALLFIMIGLIAGRNVGMFALGLTLLLIYTVSSWWKDNALTGVTYQRTFDRTRVFPNEPVTMTVSIGNHKPLPLTWLRFDDRMPVAPQEAGQVGEMIGQTHGQYTLQNTLAIGGNSQVRRRFTLAFPRRGFYTLGPVTYRSGDIFTLFTIERDYDDTNRIVVFPRVWPLEELGLPAKEPFGELNVQKSLFTDPIRTQGIRDYHPQDRFRDVHWKASARRGSLQTKVYDPSTGMTMAVFLNVATMRRHWMGFDPQQLERAISVAASVASYGVEQKWGVGLYVNGTFPKSDQSIRVPPGRSPEQLAHILEALAATTEFATASIEKLMTRESPRLPWPATLVLITAHVTEEMAAVLVRLKKAGRRVALISLAEEPPPFLDSILAYHIPPDTPLFEEQAGQQAQATLATGKRAETEASLATIPAPEAMRQDEE